MPGKKKSKAPLPAKETVAAYCKELYLAICTGAVISDEAIAFLKEQMDYLTGPQPSWKHTQAKRWFELRNAALIALIQLISEEEKKSPTKVMENLAEGHLSNYHGELKGLGLTDSALKQIYKNRNKPPYDALVAGFWEDNDSPMIKGKTDKESLQGLILSTIQLLNRLGK